MLMESCPWAIRKAFEPSQTRISSDFVQDLFLPIFSPKGSNKRVVEEALIMTWVEYLQCLEGGLSGIYTCIIIMVCYF